MSDHRPIASKKKAQSLSTALLLLGLATLVFKASACEIMPRAARFIPL